MPPPPTVDKRRLWAVTWGALGVTCRNFTKGGRLVKLVAVLSFVKYDDLRMTQKIIWHLPFGMIGGTETLYATILKYIGSYENYITCHESILTWCQEKFEGRAKVRTFTDYNSLATVIDKIKPNLIIGTHGKTLYKALECTKSEYPIIEVVHGSHVWSEHNVNMPKNWTQHVVCVSKSAERTYLANTKENIPTSVIINGVDTEIFQRVQGIRVEAKTIGYIGRFMETDKHITKILDAVKDIHGARVHLVGGNETEIIRLKHHARFLKMNDRVNLAGHTDRPENHYEHLDLFTVRSEAEGYCNSAAEAMACGVPMVCFNFGGIIEHAPAGAIAVANNQSEYVKKLKEVYNDYDLRSKMVETAYEFITHEGNALVMVEKYRELISKVLSIEKSILPRNFAVKSVIKRPVVGVCNLSWQGIATATKSVCDVVMGPKKMVGETVKEILSQEPRAVLLSGWCPGFKDIAKMLQGKVSVYAYYHGGPSHYSFQRGLFGKEESAAFQEIIDLVKLGVIKKIAVSSPGFAEVLKSCGIPAEFCGNLLETHRERIGNPLGGIHIGNWNRHHDHKHTTIGLAATQLIKDAEVHCLRGAPRVPGLTVKVNEYPEMVQHQLEEKYSQMTVNLQMSFIETFNISVMEMWSCGRPVVLGPGNFEMVKDSDLLDHVMCWDHTNPVALAKTIKHCIAVADHIIPLQFARLKRLNTESGERWARFFES